MEKRIKALYIITIIAILAFLGMQVYWLYTRYEFSLVEYERGLSGRIVECVNQYNEIRRKSKDLEASYRDKPNGDNILTVPTFSLKQEYGDSVKTTRTAKVSTYIYSAHKLLGLEPGTPLSEAQKDKALDLAQTQLSTAADSVVYDASGARDENEAWAATQNVQAELKCRFTTQGLDSVLHKAGIEAAVDLLQADSMVWDMTVENHKSAFAPEVSVTVPYSQLEGKVVIIKSAVNPLDVLPGMWQTLIATFVISTLLIVCLVLQISTVLRLSRLDKMRNSFIVTMIHELKRPISTLKMCVSGLENERMMDDREVKKELLSETRNALDNLSAYFSKLRDITFNNVEQIPLNIRSVKLRDLFEDVVSAITVLPGKSVDVRDMIDESVEVSADRSHLYNIINNLVENAVKYSGASVEIRASATVDNGTVELSIDDTGNGISSGDLKHIFKRFYRGKATAGEQPGMGLGLTYVRLLVEAHGGDISVQSAEGEGTSFTVRLPQ